MVDAMSIFANNDVRWDCHVIRQDKPRQQGKARRILKPVSSAGLPGWQGEQCMWAGPPETDYLRTNKERCRASVSLGYGEVLIIDWLVYALCHTIKTDKRIRKDHVGWAIPSYKFFVILPLLQTMPVSQALLARFRRIRTGYELYECAACRWS